MSSQAYTNFNNDFSNLQANLSNFTEMQGNTTSLQQAYKSELDGINWNSKNPWILMIAVMQLILDPGTNEINNQIDMTGQQSECQTSLLKCQQDLQDITSEKGNGSAGLTDEAKGLDQMLNELKTTQAQAVFGSSGCADLSSNLLTVRHEIYLGDGDAYDPASTSKYYFSPTGANGAMTSYGQMINGISEQGNTDAVQANTQMSNAFNTNTSILQSVQQQAKEELTQWINTVKTLASAGSMFGHSISQVTSAAEQNMRPQ